MANRASKVGLNLKPSIIPQTTPGFSNAIKNIFLICKQVWYIPFFWTLTWYSYWILRATIILNTPLIQLNLTDCIGAAISTSILIVALVQRRFHADKRITITAYHKVENEAQKIHEEKLQKSRINYQTIIRSAPEKLEETPRKLTVPKPIDSITARGVDYFKHHTSSQEILAECLTCENLISCRHRRSQPIGLQDQGSQTARCPFAQKLLTNKTVSN
jgi:hypothetical protein